MIPNCFLLIWLYKNESGLLFSRLLKSSKEIKQPRQKCCVHCFDSLMTVHVRNLSKVCTLVQNSIIIQNVFIELFINMLHRHLNMEIKQCRNSMRQWKCKINFYWWWFKKKKRVKYSLYCCILALIISYRHTHRWQRTNCRTGSHCPSLRINFGYVVVFPIWSLIGHVRGCVCGSFISERK